MQIAKPGIDVKASIRGRPVSVRRPRRTPLQRLPSRFSPRRPVSASRILFCSSRWRLPSRSEPRLQLFLPSPTRRYSAILVEVLRKKRVCEHCKRACHGSAPFLPLPTGRAFRKRRRRLSTPRVRLHLRALFKKAQREEVKRLGSNSVSNGRLNESLNAGSIVGAILKHCSNETQEARLGIVFVNEAVGWGGRLTLQSSISLM